MNVEVCGEVFELLPHKAIYWPKMKSVFMADLHLGKINHFRRSGIQLPNKANDRNIEMLVDLLQLTKPDRVICLGDLFHSHYNPEWEVFGEVIKHFQGMSFELVLGNHDIMSELQYERKGIKLHDTLVMDQFVFTHHPLQEIEPRQYNLAGHIHPGVALHGRGRQALTLPCFYFGQQQALLPAFGVFTGLARIKPLKNDKIFVIVENKILPVGAPTVDTDPI
jgi:DNA ligase-associated metallophosphoesterase